MKDEGTAGRIGIFEYDWALYSFIKDFVIKLAESGYKVDVFQKDPIVEIDFTDTTQFNQYENVRFFNFTISNTLAQKIIRKFKSVLGRISWDYAQNPKNIIDLKILQNSKKIIKDTNYQCFIGIEKKGLIWAGILAQLHKCPLIYYSLELYLEDHPALRWYKHLRRAEKQYHQLSGATIIQDWRRAETLIKYNGIKSTNLFYFPISARGDIVEKKNSYFHQKFNIKETQKILLYFGLIQQERYSTDLVRMARNLSEDITLALHGYGEQTYLDHLRSEAVLDRVIFSLDLVKDQYIVDVISSATIGLALYENTSSNDRLTAFSSVKVAYYMQCGVPVIAFDSESYRELMNVYKCGELINSIDEIPLKVVKILNNYDGYKEQAYLAFRHFYDFDKNFERFKRDYIGFIENKGGFQKVNDLRPGYV